MSEFARHDEKVKLRCGICGDHRCNMDCFRKHGQDDYACHNRDCTLNDYKAVRIVLTTDRRGGVIRGVEEGEDVSRNTERFPWDGVSDWRSPSQSRSSDSRPNGRRNSSSHGDDSPPSSGSRSRSRSRSNGPHPWDTEDEPRPRCRSPPPPPPSYGSPRYTDQDDYNDERPRRSHSRRDSGGGTPIIITPGQGRSSSRSSPRHGHSASSSAHYSSDEDGEPSSSRRTRSRSSRSRRNSSSQSSRRSDH